MDETPLFLDRAKLLDGDVAVARLESLQRSGELHRLRRGRYIAGEVWARSTEQERHRLRALELGGELGGRAVISHESAALLLGLELPAGPPGKVHVTWPGSPGRRATTNVHPHRGRLDRQDLTLVEGVLTTCAARTVFDVARSSTPERTLAAADSALRLNLTTAAQLRAVIERNPGIPGAFLACRLLAFADARAESVGESICRLRMAQLGLPIPELQTEIRLAGQGTTARVDFDFAGQRTVCEFDGRVKYGRLLQPGQSPGDAVFHEKVREDRIRDTGRQMVRVTWADLARGAAVLQRFGAAFARAGCPDWRPEPRRFLTAADLSLPQQISPRGASPQPVAAAHAAHRSPRSPRSPSRMTTDQVV